MSSQPPSTREQRSPVVLSEVFSTSIWRKTKYLLKVSFYASITTALVLAVHSGWAMVLHFLPLLLVVPLIVSIPACFLTVHREIANEELTQQLRDALAHDPLTKSHTRQALYERFDSTVSKRVIAMIDVDHFKRVNDTYGHLVGDQVLRRIADIARAQIRDDDMLCRFGGEEFAALLVDTTLDEALRVCTRIRTALTKTEISTPEGPVRVTVSIGLTPVGSHESIDVAIARADEALYRAKEGGRNRTELSSRTLSPKLQSA